MKARIVPAVGVAVLMFGCSSWLDYRKVSSNLYIPRVDIEQVRIYETEPTASYEVIGVMEWPYRRMGGKEERESALEAINELKKIAWKHGADAVVIWKQRKRFLRRPIIVAKAVRFLNPPVGAMLSP